MACASIRFIFKSVHRGPACGRATDDTTAFPLKVIGPDLLAWVENGCAPPRGRVRGHAACAFAERARHAGEGEIFEHGRTAIRERVNVIGMKLRLLPRL